MASKRRNMFYKNKKQETTEIDHERLGAIRQYAATVCACMSGFLCGSAFAWITPLMPEMLGPHSEVPMTEEQLSWVVAAIEVGDIFTPIPCALLADRFGRKPVLLSTGPCYLVAWLVILETRSVPGLYLARFIQGLGLGISYSVLPVYLGEIASPKRRALLGVCVQYSWYMGIIFEYAIGPFLEYDQIMWTSLSFTIVYVLAFAWFPETPHNLASRGLEEEAARSLSWFRGGGDVSAEMEGIMSGAEWRRWGAWGQLVGSRGGLKAMGLIFAVMANALMGGLLTTISYSSVVFSSGAAVTSSLLLGLLLLLTVPVFGRAMDYFGRRPVYLLSSGVSFVCILLVAVYRLLCPPSVPPVVADLLLIVYLVFIAGGVEAAFPVLQAELFPGRTRVLASSLTILMATFLSFVSFVTFYYLTAAVGIYANFFLYAFFCAFGFIVIAAYLPETKGKSLEEIQKSF